MRLQCKLFDFSLKRSIKKAQIPNCICNFWCLFFIPGFRVIATRPYAPAAWPAWAPPAAASLGEEQIGGRPISVALALLFNLLFRYLDDGIGIGNINICERSLHQPIIECEKSLGHSDWARVLDCGTFGIVNKSHWIAKHNTRMAD